jgi:hypothetical protein
MAISTQSLAVDPDGWAVNATSSDASGGEELEAAPGTGKRLILQELYLSANQSAAAIIDSRASATATITRMAGPILLQLRHGNVGRQYIRGVKALVNEAIFITSSGSSYINVYASGVIKT